MVKKSKRKVGKAKTKRKHRQSANQILRDQINFAHERLCEILDRDKEASASLATLIEDVVKLKENAKQYEKYIENPQIGYCSYGSHTIWNNDQKIVEGGRMYHPICKLDSKYRSLSPLASELLLNLEAAVRSMGYCVSCGTTEVFSQGEHRTSCVITRAKLFAKNEAREIAETEKNEKL